MRKKKEKKGGGVKSRAIGAPAAPPASAATPPSTLPRGCASLPGVHSFSGCHFPPGCVSTRPGNACSPCDQKKNHHRHDYHLHLFKNHNYKKLPAAPRVGRANGEVRGARADHVLPRLSPRAHCPLLPRVHVEGVPRAPGRSPRRGDARHRLHMSKEAGEMRRDTVGV
ncbi:hypothetical protein T492DRAFT_8993 [Pavlovales sp. CCMP2436]|nr:hypothetical protein T492DRAFT_8993 [Pavlovales sp. CCMP2436]